MKKRKGFTLVELLVVISVLGVIGSLALVMFVNTLRGAIKSQIISSIKQNGQSILETIDKTIRSSKSVVCVSSDSKTLVVEKGDIYTSYIRYRILTERKSGQVRDDCMVASGNSDTSKPTNGCIIQDNPEREESEILDFDSFVNRVCNSADPLSSGLILSDIKPDTGVSVKSGSFTITGQLGFKDVIGVEFKLGPGVGATPIVRGQIDPVSFQTTIELR